MFRTVENPIYPTASKLCNLAEIEYAIFAGKNFLSTNEIWAVIAANSYWGSSSDDEITEADQKRIGE